MKESYATILLLTVALLLVGCQSSSQSQVDERLSAMKSVRRLALGCHMYADDNDGMLPNTMTGLQPYVVELFDPEAYVLVASGKLREIENSSNAVLLRQKELLPDGQQAVAFVDGHVEIVPVQ